jgi:hypothetical protein
MGRHRSKTELLKDVQVQRRRLEAHVGALTPTEMLACDVVGTWSVKDLLAHLAAWEQLLLSWYDAGLAGTMPATAAVGMSTKAIADLNQRIYVQNRQRSLKTIQAEFARSYQRVWACLQGIPEEAMFAEGLYAWTGGLTVADYIAGNTCNHYRWATAQIRKRFGKGKR